MNSFSEMVIAKAKYRLSPKEREAFSVVENFLRGIAQKNKLLLEKSLDDDARIELRWMQSGKVVQKDRYIQIVTVDNSSVYRSDFHFLDVIIEIDKNRALAKGIFIFQDEPLSSSLLWIKLIKKRGRWFVVSNSFGFFDFQPESVSA